MHNVKKNALCYDSRKCCTPGNRGRCIIFFLASINSKFHSKLSGLYVVFSKVVRNSLNPCLVFVFLGAEGWFMPDSNWT